jgi:hypothetical protein
MVHHRRGCDSYQEHRDKLAASPPAADKSEQEIVKWECPHVDCIAFAHTHADLVSHMKWCSKIREGVEAAVAETEAGLGDFSRDLDNLVAYEKWSRENGREP